MRPVCPFCQQEMVPIRWAAEDGSGYTFGWKCGCNAHARADMPFDEVIVESAATVFRVGNSEVYLSQLTEGEAV